MAEYVLETADQIIQRMVDYYRTAQSDITDFNDGSEVMNLLSSVGVSAYEVRYYIDYMLRMGYPHTAEGDYLDMIGVLVKCTRKGSVQATGSVTYTLSAPVAYNIDIPAGSVVTSGSDISLGVETIPDSTLVAGQTSITILAEAQSGGTEGNVAIGILDTLGDPIDALSVTNTVAFTGGEATESDGDYRVRILEAGKSGTVGSIAWYQILVEAITGVHDCAIINNPFGEAYNMTIYVNGTAKPTTDLIMADVEALFLLPANIIGGVNLIVSLPDYSVQNISANITIDPSYSWSNVSADIETNITAYFNGGTTTYGTVYDGLNIGDDIVQSRIEMIIGNTMGVTDYTLSSPSGNVVMTDNGAGELGTFTLTEV